MNHWSDAKTKGGFGFALLLLCVTASLRLGHPVRPPAAEPGSATFGHTAQFKTPGVLTIPPPGTKGRSVRRVYGHALVAGGIHSIDELMAVIARDPQLAEHYKNFDLSKAHIITLDHNVVAYVSYRLAKGIYWEAKPTIIAKGEQVITDGTNFIRVRCGNLISYAPGPTSPGEPEDMDIVVALTHVDPPIGPATGDIPIPMVPNSPLPAPPLLGPGPPPPPPGGWFPPVVPPCCGGGGEPPIPPPWNPPTQVSADEFSTISLTILGHSYKLPSGGLAFLAGVFLVVAVRFAAWKQTV